ncbi:uncharacterized protein AB9W97_001043 [Spinachia spinachia]
MTTLSHQMSRLSPIADNMANFAQESQGALQRMSTDTLRTKTKYIIVDKLSRTTQGCLQESAGALQKPKDNASSPCHTPSRSRTSPSVTSQSLTGEVYSAPKREWQKRTQAASTWGPSSMTRTVPPLRPLSLIM